MNNALINRMVAIVLLTGEICLAQGCGDANAAKPVVAKQERPVDEILAKMNETARQLKSYQCRVEYLFSQPMLDSKTLRTGTLYYARFGAGSKLRIDFDTLTQEDGPTQNYKECFIFDGQWLTHIDYQIKQVQKRQLAEPNEPIDAFELAKRNFPLIGFGQTADLDKQFDVNLVIDSNNQIHLVDEQNDIVHLHLKVKPGSQYAEQYKSVDIWIDKATDLPEKITAISTEDDIYEIRFIEPKVNEPINEKLFEVEIPKGSGEVEFVPLKGN